jgi:hypothetical protein
MCARQASIAASDLSAPRRNRRDGLASAPPAPEPPPRFWLAPCFKPHASKNSASSLFESFFLLKGEPGRKKPGLVMLHDLSIAQRSLRKPSSRIEFRIEFQSGVARLFRLFALAEHGVGRCRHAENRVWISHCLYPSKADRILTLEVIRACDNQFLQIRA